MALGSGENLAGLSAMEDVSAYSRLPALRPVPRRVRIMHRPVYYLSPRALVEGAVEPVHGTSLCDCKGLGRYGFTRSGLQLSGRAGWSYPEPDPTSAAMRDHVAVYARAMEAWFVGDEQVTPRPGGFYGGWSTRSLEGPFKGGPGSMGW